MAGFQPMFDYLAALELHNERPWFHEHHKEYEAAVKDYLNLLDLTRFSVAENDPAIAESILTMHPKDWMYRVARDARVNRDKPPYNPSFRAYISADRKSFLPIGYFICLAPGASLFGTGLWAPETALLNQVRDYMLAHWEELEEILDEAGIPVTSDNTLKKLPIGYREYTDHPAAGLLKMKGWDMIVHLPPETFTDFDSYDAAIRDAVKRMAPFRRFLLEASSKKHLSAEQKTTQQLRDFYGSW